MVKVGLVGCGRISNRHVDAILANKGKVKVAWVCDKKEERARALAEKLGCNWCTNYLELNGKGLDVISVLTPSGLHPRHVCAIAEQVDAPNILCEKPLSLTLREAYEVFRRVEKAGKRLIPVYQNRFNPIVQMMKKLIDTGKLGKVHQFCCNVFWNRNDAYFAIDWHGTKEFDGGVMYTQASHYVDMLHFFFGKAVAYKGLAGNLRGLETDDSVSSVIRFENGAVGTLNATVSVYEKNYLTEFTVIGEKGTVRLSGTNLNEISFWNVKGLKKPEMDFKLDHQYGKGHNVIYKYIAQKKWDAFPKKDDILSGIRLMEMLSY